MFNNRFNTDIFYRTFKGIQGLKITSKNSSKAMEVLSFLNIYLNVDHYTRTYVNEETNSFEMYYLCNSYGIENWLTGEVADIVIKELREIDNTVNVIKLNKNNIQDIAI